MKILKTADIPANPRESALFRGHVTAQTVLDSENKNLRTSLINFDAGAVNVFHVHDSDQILYVTAGEGIIATEQGETRIVPGDFVHIPAGEKHWHGATPGSSMSHIAISLRGKTSF